MRPRADDRAAAPTFNRIRGMMARALILIGALLVFAGVAMLYAPWLVNWFGRLPGDIRIERDNGVIYIPVTSMLVVSVVLSLVVSFLFRR